MEKGDIHLIRRILPVLGVVTLLVIAAEMISPPDSRANRPSPDYDRATPQNRVDTSSTTVPRLIGQFVGSDLRVHVFAGEPEPTFSVYHVDGRLLAEQLRREELAVRFPDLSIDDRWGGGGEESGIPLSADINTGSRDGVPPR